MALTFMQRLCPPILRRHLRTARDRFELAFLGPIPCDTDSLRQFTDADLRAIFSSEAIARDWEGGRQLLATLGLPELTGGVNPGDQRAIYHLIHALQPKSVLEIGTHVGCSTANIALALKQVSAADSCRRELTTVDVRDVNDPATKPWAAFDSSASPRELLQRIDCSDSVSFLVADSLAFLATCRRQFDFIFLDGDHSARKVFQEIPLALERLNPGGTILLHDYFPELRPLYSDKSVLPGPYLAARRLIRQGARFRVCPLGQLPWPTKLNSSFTTLAVLSKVD